MKKNLFSIFLISGLLSLIACGSGSGVSDSSPIKFTIGGIVSGLKGAGLVLQSNNSTELAITANGSFTFATPLSTSETYEVSVKTQPNTPIQTCIVSNSNGTVENENIENVIVTCTDLKPPHFAYVLPSPGFGLSSGTEIYGYSIDLNTGAFNSIGTFAGMNNPDFLAAEPKGRYLYVAKSSAPDIASAPRGRIVTYQIEPATGNLRGVGEVIIQDSVNGLIFEPSGKFAYSIGTHDNNGSIVGSISIFSVNVSTGVLTNLGTVPAGGTPSGITIDKDGKFLYLVSDWEIRPYTINPVTGVLIRVNDVSMVIVQPNAKTIIAEPIGRFIFSDSNNQDIDHSLIISYAINSTTGRLTGVSSTNIRPAESYAIYIDPIGRFLYVPTVVYSVSVFLIDSLKGFLTIGGTFSVGHSNVTSIAIDPSGKFIYIGTVNDGVFGFTINPTTGALERNLDIPIIYGVKSMIIVGY